MRGLESIQNIANHNVDMFVILLVVLLVGFLGLVLVKTSSKKD